MVALANIKQNNLTLKALQEKIDRLEKGNRNYTPEVPEGKEGKVSIILNVFNFNSTNLW